MSANEHSPDEQPDGASSFVPPDWWIYRGTSRPQDGVRLDVDLPPPPPWRDFNGGPLPEPDEPPEDDGQAARRLGSEYHLTEQDVNPHEVDMVNTALYLRRPLLVTGQPGTGKSGLAFQIARELNLGRVLRWPITSHTTLRSGQYEYDAIARAQAAGALHAAARYGPAGDAPVRWEPPLGEFLRLGPLGTAFLPRRRPRVLLIDELDKSEADLPNDLLIIFEDGEFTIPELHRVRERTPEITVFTDDPGASATIVGGRVLCNAFPIIVITSNGERDFPPAFLRRCVRLDIKPPTESQLVKMAANHLLDRDGQLRPLVREFVERGKASGGLPADKLLDTMFLATSGAYRQNDASWRRLIDALWRPLSSMVP
ncbi:MAG TPA: MoxR family ATPase [Actinophytocola sp.]|uniref:AAA family ATPase n=1 Tax=Actinophytocola sp. TaxID=1872138 RepID=UPI002DBA6B17|nr:MoxR family ATPase [Actinophytocola sp.]HEU5470526.1 MoxR family ATPase [Actinophytocola sp.]